MPYDRWEQLGDLLGLLDDLRNDIFFHINSLSENVPFEELAKKVVSLF